MCEGKATREESIIICCSGLAGGIEREWGNGNAIFLIKKERM